MILAVQKFWLSELAVRLESIFAVRIGIRLVKEEE